MVQIEGMFARPILLVQSFAAGSTSPQALTPNHTEMQQVNCCKVIIFDELILLSSPGPGNMSISAYAPLAKVNQLSVNYCGGKPTVVWSMWPRPLVNCSQERHPAIPLASIPRRWL